MHQFHSDTLFMLEATMLFCFLSNKFIHSCNACIHSGKVPCSFSWKVQIFSHIFNDTIPFMENFYKTQTRTKKSKETIKRGSSVHLVRSYTSYTIAHIYIFISQKAFPEKRAAFVLPFQESKQQCTGSSIELHTNIPRSKCLCNFRDPMHPPLNSLEAFAWGTRGTRSLPFLHFSAAPKRSGSLGFWGAGGPACAQHNPTTVARFYE